MFTFLYTYLFFIHICIYTSGEHYFRSSEMDSRLNTRSMFDCVRDRRYSAHMDPKVFERKNMFRVFERSRVFEQKNTFPWSERLLAEFSKYSLYVYMYLIIYSPV